MAKAPYFASLGNKTDSIDVQLSYRIVELFSEGLYSSPNKAIEELVANSFDAGALKVHVLLSNNLHDQDATIAIIDDGQGMDVDGLKQHWLIGLSNKRRLGSLPRNRQQIGKFGIGKLATYVLADRLTHITKVDGRYYSTSMDYSAIDSRINKEVEPKSPIKIPLLELTEGEAQNAVNRWTETASFKSGGLELFGASAPNSWTVAVMSSLKDKVFEIKPGVLKWVLRTALPLRPDFVIRLNNEDLVSSKSGKGLLKKWTIGRDLIDLPRPGPKEAVVDIDESLDSDDDKKFGLVVPEIGRVSGYVETYEDLLTGKSDDVGRSYGFFVFVFGRLINVTDGHFGISPNELRHGTFGRIRLVIHMDGLDKGLRSNRESVSEGPLLTAAQNVLRAIFNSVRQSIETHDESEEPGAKLARKLAASPASLSRRPIVQLARAVVGGKRNSRFLIIPDLTTDEEKEAFVDDLEQRSDDADEFLKGLTIDYEGDSQDGLARFDTVNGVLRINAYHPFVAAFHDEFVKKRSSQPLELLAMAEVLSESHLFAIGMSASDAENYLSLRDQLLRNLANETGRKSAFAVAADLIEARNDSDKLEEQLCAAFRSLGFDAVRIGGKKEPDGVASAHLAVANDGTAQSFKISLEAKSKEKDKGKVAAATVNVSRIARHRDSHECHHAIVVGRDFPTATDDNSLEQEINADIEATKAKGAAKTITLMRIDDLARLVRLRPVKQVRLQQLRELLATCRTPDECAAWVESIAASVVSKPPYETIVSTIEDQQKKYDQAPVSYGALRVALSIVNVEFNTDEELREICRGMQQMAPGALYAHASKVELDQSAQNVISAIEGATSEFPSIETAGTNNKN